MKLGALVLASILVSLTGALFAVPIATVAAEDTVACPAYLCIIHSNKGSPASSAQVWPYNPTQCWINSGLDFEDECARCCNQCENTESPYEVKGPTACYCVTIGHWDYCPF